MSQRTQLKKKREREREIREKRNNIYKESNCVIH